MGRDPRPCQQDTGRRPGLSHAHGHAGGVLRREGGARARLSSGRGWGPPSRGQGGTRGGWGGGEGAAPPPPPGPPRSWSCSGPAAAPPGSARQAPPARRGRGWGVDAGAYAFARKRMQEGPGGRHLVVIARGPRGVAQAAHGARGVLGAAPVSAWVPCSRSPAPTHPACTTSPSAARPYRPSLRGDKKLRCWFGAQGQGIPGALVPLAWGQWRVQALPSGATREFGGRGLSEPPLPWRGGQSTSGSRRRRPGTLVASCPGA